MNFTCDKNMLQDALAMAGRAVSSRATNPILECVLVTAQEGVGVTIIGNDKDICIETAAFPAEVEVGGSIALDAKLFTEIVRKITGEMITIEADDSFNAMCKSGRSRLKISGLDAEEFPMVSESELSEVTSSYKIGSALLRDMIKQTIFSVSLDTSKPVLTGEKFEVKNGMLEVVAIDMFRISYFSAGLGDDAVDSTAVIPGKALTELSRLLPEGDAEISFYFTQNKAVFEAEGFRLIPSLLSGDFIRYDQIYNEDFATMVVVDRVALLGAFERSVLVAAEGRMLPVKLDIADDDITITAQSERGQVDDGVPCETEGKDLTIYFNPKYFIDVLRALEEERVIVKFNTVLSPCLIKGHDSDKGLRYLIVPLRPPS
jgi:DNA polymerase-3 subunit beta